MMDHYEPSQTVLDHLKGQCHGIFDFRFFSMNQFPPNPGINDTSSIGDKFAAGVVDTGGAP
jgi:hypothetical protein